MKESRRHPRMDTVTAGKVLIADHFAAIDCTILDISEKGACILISNATDLPPIFRLIVDGTNLCRDCELIWNTGNRIGVSFLPSGTKE